ncbi:hypothetical protein JYU10_00665 [bacterium AH-315-J04]|nr:hypothetical protein [bacterium AH-315-J04]
MSQMTYDFPRSAMRRVMHASNVADIKEVCYLLFGRGRRIISVIRVPNRAEDQVLNHIFLEKDFNRVRNRSSLEGLNFLGYLHSHPISKAILSKGDIEGYPYGSLLFVYADIYKELRAYRTRQGRPRFHEQKIRFY